MIKNIFLVFITIIIFLFFFFVISTYVSKNNVNKVDINKKLVEKKIEENLDNLPFLPNDTKDVIQFVFQLIFYLYQLCLHYFLKHRLI